MKLDHILLAMPAGEEQKARHFFTEILGMEEEAKPAPLNTRGGSWFKKDEVKIHVGGEENFRPQKKAHPALVVSNLDELAAKLVENNYPVKWDDALPECKRFFTEDPFGNRIEFIEE
jgi:extradiol dioxygenase family protein